MKLFEILRSTTAAVALSLTPALAAPVDQGPKNVPEFKPAFPNQTRAPALQSGVTLNVETVAQGLQTPWGIEVLPQGGYLVTERTGSLRMIDKNGTLSDPIKGVPEVLNQNQGGLLDVELAQDFATSRMVYLTYAKPMGQGMSATAAARGTLSEDLSELRDVQDIFVQSPPSPNPMHFGSRIVLSGDHAFITTGEHSSQSERVFAQHLDKTYGKVIRVMLDGAIPADNPFAGQAGADGAIWSYGHRNPQGADIRPETGQLWALEHGPKGGDELNLITPGANYGWPVISYGEEYSGTSIAAQPRAKGMAEPQYYWDPVIAPGGFVFYQGDMFSEWNGDILASSLNPGGLVRLTLDGDKVSGEERFLTGENRIRDVEIDSDGAILLLVDAPNGAVLRLTRR